MLGSVCAASRGTGIRQSAPDPNKGARNASGVIPTGHSLCSHADPARSDTFTQSPIIDKQTPVRMSRDGAGARMAKTSESKSTTTPAHSPNASPKPESAPSEETRSQGRVVVEPKEPPAAPTNAARALRIRVAPQAALPQREATPTHADSTADAKENQDGRRRSTGGDHSCHICRRRYRSLEWLHRHVVTHERGKPLKCDRCGRSYMRRLALARHMKYVHGV